ncbi:MAG TPA: hypothetical protein VFU49_23580 [Ktedonobacteraceae bacterium]|nr:hypothetical protein [Ktedonobacteraceae bacterium]
MARRFHPRSTPAENLRFIIHSIPWKLLFLLPILIVIAVPTYFYGTRLGGNVIPSFTDFFDKLSAPAPPPTPTPLPVFPSGLPQAGSLLYTVQDGDSCDSILLFQMHMFNAGEIFSDVKPNTVQALNATFGHDCHQLQPGMTLPLSPHYPLVGLGGVVTKIEASTPQQVLPTPLIKIPPQQQLGVDCSGHGGCLLTLRIAPAVNIHLLVQTALPVRVGSWIWAQAMFPRKAIRGFDTYPYADPRASLNGATMRACDVQVDNTHDDDSLACSSLMPNTIDIDGGSWILGVTGPGGLDHWHYGVNVAPNTRVLLWLSDDNGNLRFQRGNPAYRYDETSHLYVKI